MPMSKTERNLWNAFLGEAKANRTYAAYGIKPLEEGLPEVAAVGYLLGSAFPAT